MVNEGEERNEKRPMRPHQEYYVRMVSYCQISASASTFTKTAAHTAQIVRLRLLYNHNGLQRQT